MSKKTSDWKTELASQAPLPGVFLVATVALAYFNKDTFAYITLAISVGLAFFLYKDQRHERAIEELEKSLRNCHKMALETSKESYAVLAEGSKLHTDSITTRYTQEGSSTETK